MTRHILVTGANKGIGLAAVANILEQTTDTFVYLGSRDSTRGTQAVEQLAATRKDAHNRVKLLNLDVAEQSSVAAAFEAVAEHLASTGGHLYALVNNAGIGLQSNDMAAVLNVNTFGAKRVCDTFVSLLGKDGRIVNVSSASAPNFVSRCAGFRQAFFQDASLGWNDIQQLIDQVLASEHDADAQALGLGGLDPYGFSKACLSLYTLILSRQYPTLCINACTPGYIETDLTRPVAESRGLKPEELGMKPPAEGTRSILHLLFATLSGNGYYYGSDAKRSPWDRYRAPGSPAFEPATAGGGQ